MRPFQTYGIAFAINANHIQKERPQVKNDTTPIRASHVNAGTAIPRAALATHHSRRPVMRLGKLHLVENRRDKVTPFGGIALLVGFFRKFRVAQRIDSAVRVFTIHNPYHESDHVLALATSLYLGGSCLEDLAILQHDEAARRPLGASRLPDPTTAGDFLRRFHRRVAPKGLGQLRRAVDDLQEAVWRKLPRRHRKRATIDLDGKVKEFSSTRKEGADFSYGGKWSYQPLMASLAETGECLAVQNKPGNLRSSEGAAEMLKSILPRIKKSRSPFAECWLAAIVTLTGPIFAVL